MLFRVNELDKYVKVEAIMLHTNWNTDLKSCDSVFLIAYASIPLRYQYF